MINTGDDSTQTTSKPLRRKQMRWFIVLTIVILLSAWGYLYRREAFVWFAIDAGGASLDWNMIPQALETRRALLDERLAACRQKSDIEATQFLKKLLTASINPLNTELDQRFALNHLKELPKQQQALFVTELTGFLEKGFGDLSLTAIDILRSLGPLAEGETDRLLHLASSGDPVWRRTNALSILASFKSNSPEVIGALVRAAGEDSDQNNVREEAQRLLNSQAPSVKVMAGKKLLASKFIDARLSALQMLESAAADSMIADALKATQDPSGQVRTYALFMLRRVALTEAIEAANKLRKDEDSCARAAAIGTLLRSPQPPGKDEVNNVVSSLYRTFSSPDLGPEIRLRCLHSAADLAPEKAVAWAKDALETTRKEIFFTDYHRTQLQNFIAAHENKQ